jgi:hypothetical protein
MMWPIRSIALGAGGGWVLVFWLALALALALAIWAYRAPVPPLPRPARVGLAALRFLGLALLLLTLFQPVVTVASRAGDRPQLVALVDLSASMRFPASAASGDTTTRFQSARDLLADLRPGLEREFDVGIYGFGERVLPAAGEAGPPFATATPDQPATDLGAALRAVLAAEGPRPAALLVLSDGGVNSGPDPVALAERGAVPVIAVPASLDSMVNDACVAECFANRTAYLGQETAVLVTLSSRLVLPTRVSVALSDEERVVSRSELALPAGAARVPVEIRFRPDRLGVHRFTIALEPVPGELTANNNRRAFAVEVEEERLQVLLIADRPSWDVTFLRRALAGDKTLAVTALVRMEANGAYRPLGGAKLGGLPTRPRDLAAFATVVLVDVDLAKLPAGTRAALAGFVRDGGGLLVVGAPGAGREGAATDLERLLPVRAARAPGAAGLFTSRLTAAGSVHPVTACGESPSRAEQIWAELPPIRPGILSAVGLAGEVLVEGIPGEGYAGRNPGKAVPLVIAGRTPGGRTLVVNASLVWRWSFLVAGSTGDDLLQRRFWTAAVRWLARGKGGDNLEIFADQPVFLRGRPVTLGARLTDDELQPVSNAAVTVELVPVDAPARTRDAAPAPITLGPARGEGSYAGRAGSPAPGLYRLRGEAQRGADRWRAEGGQLLVDEASVEGLSPAANPDLLRRLALATGGAFVPPAAARSTLAAVARDRATALRTAEIKLWNHPALFLAFVGCLSLEWFLRRRRGLA